MSQRLLDLPAPAKLNLFLHVTGRRADGYHLLQSVFVLIDWCDTLHLERRSDGRLQRHDLGQALPADDLVLRAARLLQQASGCTDGADLHIDKVLPAQAGMGGGSSDAATTLLGLNRLWGLNWSRQRLAALGLQLGADVPFFVHGRNAWVEGIGEQIRPIDLPPAQFEVVKPHAGVETAQIFRSPDLNRSTKPAILSVFAADPYGFGHNDLQPVAQALCPEIQAALSWLESQGLQARMTGSGSAVFAHCPEGTPPLQAPNHWTHRRCSILEVHPLWEWASSDD